MFRKKYICILFLCVSSIFFFLIFYFVCSINIYHSNNEIVSRATTEYSIEIIEHKIKIEAINLPKEYKNKQTIDFIVKNFQNNIIRNKPILNLNKLWLEFDKQVKENQIFDSNSSNIGNLIHALKTAKILHADVYSKGTQLKLILKLEGDHLAVFKPQWYDKEKIILGNVYAGKDRIASEILAFYLAAILDLRLVPIAAVRSINIKEELLPVASNLLNDTKFEYKNKICIYGKCFYCKREDPICSNDEGVITGAILFHISGKLQSYNSPWQRTYKKGKRAIWETQPNYCSTVRRKISNIRLLDLIDVAIFDFLIQNGDRHHYETFNDKVILIDNGKGLGNPYVHHFDILAPLFQCCVLRTSTWDRLKIFSGGLLSEVLQSFPELKTIVATQHFKTIDDRLQMIYATVENCRSRNKFLSF